MVVVLDHQRVDLGLIADLDPVAVPLVLLAVDAGDPAVADGDLGRLAPQADAVGDPVARQVEADAGQLDRAELPLEVERARTGIAPVRDHEAPAFADHVEPSPAHGRHRDREDRAGRSRDLLVAGPHVRQRPGSAVEGEGPPARQQQQGGQHRGDGRPTGAERRRPGIRGLARHGRGLRRDRPGAGRCEERQCRTELGHVFSQTTERRRRVRAACQGSQGKSIAGSRHPWSHRVATFRYGRSAAPHEAAGGRTGRCCPDGELW